MANILKPWTDFCIMLDWFLQLFEPTWKQVLSPSELNEFEDGKMKLVRVNKQQVLLVKHEGKLKAIQNKCPHQGAALNQEGKIKEGKLLCCRHNMKFSLEQENDDELPLSFYITELRKEGLFVKL